MFTSFRSQTIQFMKSNSRRSLSRLAFIFRKESIPYISLAVGAFALGFQGFVLHPWHDRLSEQFDKIEKEIHQLDLVTSELTVKMERVVDIGREVKAKERQNITTSQEILSKLEKTKETIAIMHQAPTPMD
jgi:hypothetical protein